jgi:outer membrane protein TolC
MKTQKIIKVLIKVKIDMKHIFLTSAIILISLANLNAQEVQEKLELSLYKAQEIALEHNRSLKNAELEIQKSEASRWQSIATMLPQLSASVEYSNMLGYKLDFQGMKIAMPAYANIGGSASMSFSATQLINVKLSDIAIKMADISLQQTKQQTANQVKSIYFSILIMEETLDLLNENLENLNKLYTFTEQSVKVGVAEQTEADQLSVQVASMKTTISSNERTLEMLYNSLRLQLSIDINKEINLTQNIDELLNIEEAMSLLSYDFVLDNNYDYQLLKENLKISEKQVNINKWAYAPSISAFYQYSNKQYFSDESTFNMTPPHVVGLSLNVPIFSSGSRNKAIIESKLNYKQQLNNLNDTKEALLVQHKQMSYNLRSAFDNYEIQKQNIEVSKRVFDNISKKYEHGIASSLELTNSNTELITAQSNYVQALMKVVSAQIELENLLNINE